MKYCSTRNSKLELTAEEAVVKGLSDEGGLFVPCEFFTLSKEEILKLCEMNYSQRVAFILSRFFSKIDYEGMLKITDLAYSSFENEDGAPLLRIDEGLYALELWHGATHAFKDVALSVLPHLLAHSKESLGIKENTLILTATSGDTGKSALEGFKDKDGIDIIVFYPCDGVSNIQKLQMQTTTGNNVAVYGIEGCFDDAQNAVKEIFSDKALSAELKERGISLSSANSINLGRLLPQIVYYFSAYADLLDARQIAFGEKINFCVPCGNFGNILAGYYAKKMGLPINKLICASNENKVLTDFFNSGSYSVEREFYKTSSPSMDILISSNLERLLYELSDRNSDVVNERMQSLKKNKCYTISQEELKTAQNVFFADFASADEVNDTIFDMFSDYGYVLDTHTAVAMSVLNKYRKKSGDESKTVLVSTANPCKFVNAVLSALSEKVEKDEFISLKLLENLTGLPTPKSLSELNGMKVRFKEIVKKDETALKVREYCQKKTKI